MKNKQLVLEHGNMMYFSREIMELTVPKEVNTVFYTIICIIVLLLISLASVRINDVVKTAGIVKTKSNNSTVNNVIAGKINKIFYKPDQFVREGDILYSLDDEIFLSLKKDLEAQLLDSENKQFCVDQLIESFYSQKNLISPDNLYVYSQLDEYLKTLAYMNRQTEILENRYIYENNLPEVLRVQRNVDESFLNYKLSLEELEKFKSSFLADAVKRKEELRLENERFRQELLRLEEQYSFLVLRAPISGFVQEISSLNEGDYVFASQAVLNIIPKDEQNFRIELHIPPKSIGKICPNMSVKLRLSAFPFFEYKGATGKIESIDSDVRKSSSGNLYYCVYTDIDRVIFANKKNENYLLRPGIEVDARIVLEKITLMSYILKKMDFI